MAGKTCPSEYSCVCGFIQSGIGLQFCGRCGKDYNKIDGKTIFKYVNECQCNANKLGYCNECESLPTPMTESQFIMYRLKISAEFKEIEEKYRYFKRRRNFLQGIQVDTNPSETQHDTGSIRIG